MKKISALLLTFLLIVSLAACGSASKSTDASSYNGSIMESATMDQMAPAEDNGLYSSSTAFSQADSEVYSDPNAKIIRSANITIQTLDFDSSVTALAGLTEQYGGYYETAQIENGSYSKPSAQRYAYYVVRVPSESYVAFRDSVGEVGYVYSAEESSVNVGEEYYDTEARLDTLTTKRERLLALLDKAELMEDIIDLENALADVQYEIDMHTSTLRKYDSLIGYSTFTISLEEVRRIDDTPTVQESFGSRLLASLKAGWVGFTDGLESFALWLARNVITLVILAVIVVVIIKIVRVVRRKRRGPYDAE